MPLTLSISSYSNFNENVRLLQPLIALTFLKQAYVNSCQFFMLTNIWQFGMQITIPKLLRNFKFEQPVCCKFAA